MVGVAGRGGRNHGHFAAVTPGLLRRWHGDQGLDQRFQFRGAGILRSDHPAHSRIAKHSQFGHACFGRYGGEKRSRREGRQPHQAELVGQHRAAWPTLHVERVKTEGGDGPQCVVFHPLAGDQDVSHALRVHRHGLGVFEAADDEIATSLGEGGSALLVERLAEDAHDRVLLGERIEGGDCLRGLRPNDHRVGARFERGFSLGGVRREGDEKHRARLLTHGGAEAHARPFAAL